MDSIANYWRRRGLGHGIFGKISLRMEKGDRRLKDAGEIPCCEGHFAAMVARVRCQVRTGVLANATDSSEGYVLDVGAGHTAWRYVRGHAAMLPVRICRLLAGKPVGTTHDTQIQTNTGMTTAVFWF